MAKQSLRDDHPARVHVTQDDFGYWMMSLEHEDGTLTPLSYASEYPDHDIHHAHRPEAMGLPADIEFWISEPSVPLRKGDPAWAKPAPRRAREPYYVVQNGRRVR
jgi:hypothetical protein